MFITPDSDDWNTHCKYFEKNENAMTNFECDIVDDKRKTNYAMYISNEYGMFQNCSVSIKNLDDNIDSTIGSAYAYDPGSMHKQCN